MLFSLPCKFTVSRCWAREVNAIVLLRCRIFREKLPSRNDFRFAQFLKARRASRAHSRTREPARRRMHLCTSVVTDPWQIPLGIENFLTVLIVPPAVGLFVDGPRVIRGKDRPYKSHELSFVPPARVPRRSLARTDRRIKYLPPVF